MRTGARLKCECGNFYEVPYTMLKPLPKRGGKPNTSSCGCARSDNALAQLVPTRGTSRPGRRTHGLSVHQLYPTWALMLQRCENPDFPKYPRYGGRGIKVCERWHDVVLFIEDIERELGTRPDRHTLDRVNNDGNYEPGNVRWASPRQQAANKPRTGTSQHRGVHWTQAKGWTARVHLGCFKDEEEAADAYRRAVAALEREGILS